MADTVNNTIADALKSYRDLDDATTPTYALRLLNYTMKKLHEEFRLATTTVNISLDGINREFAMNENHVAVWNADYLASANSRMNLLVTSVDYLDEEEGGWRRTVTGTPQRYYLWQNSAGAETIGFDIIPATATSGGYPVVELLVSVHTALAAGDSLPATLMDNQVVVAGICCEYANRRQMPDVQFRQAEYERLKNELGVYRQRRQRHNDTRVKPFLSSGVTSR